MIASLPICCVDLFVKKESSFLFVKRKYNPEKGKWWVPGGRILFNEDFIAAAKRKLKKEVNIKTFEKIEFLGTEGIKFKKGLFGQPVYSITYIFFIKVGEKDCKRVKVDETSSEFKWFSSPQKNFHPFLKKYMKIAKKK